MFSSSLRASLVALVASAVAVSAGPGLTVKTSTSNARVDGLENLKVTTTVTNTGDQTLKLLNDPRGVLNTFPEDTFSITRPAGASPAFNGAKVKYSPANVASRDDPGAFTVLAPGASIDVTHDLSTAYNFTGSGAGAYSIQPSTLFTFIGADGTLNDLDATVEHVEVDLSGTLAVSRTFDKRATFNGCSATQQSQINSATSGAQKYAASALAYISGVSSATTRYTSWFGVYDAGRKATVQSHYTSISSHQYSSFTYDCTCTDSNTYAYVYPDQFGKIYLCGAFWRAPDTGTDSRSGTLVHESSHFLTNGGTADNAYGQTACRSLAKSDPAKAIMNADSHEYFAENQPAES